MSRRDGCRQGSCAECTKTEWDAFDATLARLVGRHVRAKGIVRPAWVSTDDAAVARTSAVQLSTRLRDVLLFADGGAAAVDGL